MLDVLGATCILVLSFPLLCLIALLIKTDSPGSVLFSQKRRGLWGKPFQLYKFRTMYQECEDQLSLQQTECNDPRITRIGKFLRKYSLDELPQLLNVIRGEMSLVGPRPHALGTNIKGAELPAVSELYMMRYCVRPGITGWAQINGQRGILSHPDDLHARLDHDLYYIRNYSIILDLVVLVRTVAIIFYDRKAF